MRGQSLQQVMRQVAANVQAMPAQQQPSKRGLGTPLTELEAFARLDPLLADLHKDFLNTKKNYDTLAARFGADDAMALVAADSMDSAWCAMQTRLLELRAQRILMHRAQRLMREEEVTAHHREKLERMDAQLFWIRQIEALRRAKETGRERGLSFLEVVVFLYYLHLEYRALHTASPVPVVRRVAA